MNISSLGYRTISAESATLHSRSIGVIKLRMIVSVFGNSIDRFQLVFPNLDIHVNHCKQLRWTSEFTNSAPEPRFDYLESLGPLVSHWNRNRPWFTRGHRARRPLMGYLGSRIAVLMCSHMTDQATSTECPPLTKIKTVDLSLDTGGRIYYRDVEDGASA